MFVVATLDDTVSIAPHLFNEQLSLIVAEELDRKLANTIFQELGLCICLYDILSMGDCILLPSDAHFHIKVKFRYVVFRPSIDEILVGKETIGVHRALHTILFKAKFDRPARTESPSPWVNGARWWCVQSRHVYRVGFFDDILIPSTKLQHPSRFIETEQTWAWQYETNDETHDLVMDIGEEIRSDDSRVDRRHDRSF